MGKEEKVDIIISAMAWITGRAKGEFNEDSSIPGDLLHRVKLRLSIAGCFISEGAELGSGDIRIGDLAEKTESFLD